MTPAASDPVRAHEALGLEVAVPTDSVQYKPENLGEIWRQSIMIHSDAEELAGLAVVIVLMLGLMAL
jgi:hypothetical protein